MAEEERDPGTLAEAVLGKTFIQSDALKAFMKYPLAVRAGTVAALFAGLVLLPYLGAVGLWDPWETHYGEVAREMIQRNDYVHPYWENAWFFSKPAFAMWMMAAGMQLTGSGIAAAPNTSNDPLVPSEALGLWTEWGFRLPFVVFSILGVALLAYALARVTSSRVGLATAFVLVTMPLYFLISRQAVTDTPMIAANICAMACAILALIDKQLTQKQRDVWWMAFWVFVSVGTLAKESLGIAPIAVVAVYVILTWLPTRQQEWQEHLKWLVDKALNPALAGLGAGLVVYCITAAIWACPPWVSQCYSVNPVGHFIGVVPGLFTFILVTLVMLHRALGKQKSIPQLWAKLFEMRLGTGLLVFLAVGVPWYWRMFAFPQVDDEGKLFWFRVLVHDNFGRLASGVHTTTPGGSFTYFIEQGGFATFPWALAVPGALAVVARLTIRGEDPHDKVGVIAASWLAGSFVVMGASATKFHHYVLPMLPSLAILIGLFIDKLWSEGIAKHGLSLLLGLPFFVLVGKDLASNPKNFTDLFVYNYDRPYPFEMVQNPLNTFASRPLWLADLLAVALLGVGGYLSFEAFARDRAGPLKGLGVLVASLGVAALTVADSGSPIVYLSLGLVAAAIWVAFGGGIVQKQREPLRAFALLTGGAGALGLLISWGAYNGYGLLGGISLALNMLLSARYVAGGAAIVLIGGGVYVLLDKALGSKPPLVAAAFAACGLGVGCAVTYGTLIHWGPLIPFGLAFAAAAGWFLYSGMKTTEGNVLVLYTCALFAALPALGFLARGVQIESARGNPQQPQVTDWLQPLVADPANIKEVMGFAFIAAGVLLGCMALARAKVALFTTGIALITAWVLWFNWSHWVQLTHHWTQRDQFWRYYAQRKPGEPITAFLMNWRGETFYSRNTVKQIKDNNLLYQYAQQPGREWALVEHARLGILKGAIGPDKQVTLIDKDLNNKFVLVTIE